MNKLLYLFISLLITAVSASILAKEASKCPVVDNYDESGVAKSLAFTKQHQKTIISYLQYLEHFHFSKKQLDDNFSKNFFDLYIKRLDPRKAFFLQSDIDRLRQSYSHFLDDALRRASLAPIIDIYGTFQKRAIDRLDANIKTLQANYQLDFDTDEYFIIDSDTYNWAPTPTAYEDFWKRRIKLELLNLKLSGEETDIKDKLIRRYKTQLSYLKREKPFQVLEIYLNALGNIYDPHTNYFSPRQSENFEINMSLSLEGIGAVLQQEDEFTKITRVLPGGPAGKEGTLGPGDKIIGVGEGYHCDMIDVLGWRLDEVVKYIRGARGSTVRLKVIPSKYKNMPEQHQIITIVRDKINLDNNAAKSDLIELPGKDDDTIYIGVIDLPSFYLDGRARDKGDKNYRSSTKDVRRLIEEMKQQNELDGIIFDLRANGGGKLLEVITLTDLFIDQGPVVQIKNSTLKGIGNQKANKPKVFDEAIIVLIDRLSASASEIFAAALQDYGRGLILGTQTFGKGSVQTVRPLTHGQAKITESKFYRISGDSTQLKGVIPDIQFPQYYDPEEIGESSLDYALPWDRIQSMKYVKTSVADTIDNLLAKHKERLQNNVDLIYLQKRLALDKAKRSLKEISLNEQQRIREKEQWQQQQLEIENNWLIAKGLPPKSDKEEDSNLLSSNSSETEGSTISSGSQENLANNNAVNVETDQQDEEDAGSISNIILMEAAQIMADWVQLGTTQVASKP